MNRKKTSPFVQLRREIEDEIYNTNLEVSKLILGKVEYNVDFFLGYTEALRLMLQKAACIYNRKDPHF